MQKYYPLDLLLLNVAEELMTERVQEMRLIHLRAHEAQGTRCLVRLPKKWRLLLSPLRLYAVMFHNYYPNRYYRPKLISVYVSTAYFHYI
eukprot:g65848.t1